jgi:hypothetical protein
MLLLNKEVVPSTPATDKAALFMDTADKKLKTISDAGIVTTIEERLTNSNTVDQTINATTAYLAGSSLSVPTSKLRVGTILRWRIFATKTAAGVTAGCAFLVKVGTAGTTADTTRVTFTMGTPTGAVDTAVFDIECIVRSIGATGVMVGGFSMYHNLAATGFSTLPTECISVTSAGFDMTVANLIIGLAVTTTALSVWTVVGVTAEAINL